MKAYERLLQYVQFDTQSDPHSQTYPSTEKQLKLANHLLTELKSFGVSTILDEYGYVIGKIPSNIKRKAPKLALIAHMDTSPDASGANIRPRIIKAYAGGIIPLDSTGRIVLDPLVFPRLNDQIGHDLITSSGDTLLGADDKAGIAKIMTIVEYLTKNPHVPHGELRIVFTPDEEVGNGTKFLDVAKVDADIAYTLDGSPAGEITYENFNAASAVVTIQGKSVHPGSAKNKMVNAVLVAYEFDRLLPPLMKPELTERYEGFNHLHAIQGVTEKAVSEYIIRNHDKALFAAQKRDFTASAEKLNAKYGIGTCSVLITDSYFNMKEKLADVPYLVDIALSAIRETGLTPYVEPIRGGTDGARLTYAGLPCPNLGTGGYNYHGPFEYADIQEMDQSVEVVKKIIAKIAEL